MASTHCILRYFLTISCLFFFLVSCADDDEQPELPTQGSLQIIADWSGHSEDAVLPRNYTLLLDGTSHMVDETVYAFPSLLDPGRYTLLACNDPEGITVSGTTATINRGDDGMLLPLPGYLFSARDEVDITAGDTLHLTLKMKQHIRRLTLRLALGDGDEDRISGISSTLTGIASAFSLESGSVMASSGKILAPVFNIVHNDGLRATGGAFLSATVRLFGSVVEERQMLALTLTLSDGTFRMVETDLTDMLEDFVNGNAPLEVEAALELPVRPGTSGIITGWNVVENGGVEVN